MNTSEDRFKESDKIIKEWIEEGMKQAYLNPVSSDPKGESGKSKDQLQLIPPAFNRELAKALEQGAKKYGQANWRASKVSIMTYIGAMRRHLDALLDGQDYDESGAHHLGHVAASCAIVIDALDQGMLIDDRPINLRKKPQQDPGNTPPARLAIPLDLLGLTSEGDPHA